MELAGMDYLDRVFEVLASFEDLGQRTLANGTRLIGHVPHIAPQAWFQQIYAPIEGPDIGRLELELGHEIPAVFGDFLKRSNGLRLFSGHLYVCGLRRNHARAGEAAWQPYCILTPNLLERPRNAKASDLFIGGYEPSGSLLYLNIVSLHVYRCSARSAKPLNEWPSFEVMLESEVRRLSTRFDRAGRLIDPSARTTP